MKLKKKNVVPATDDSFSKQNEDFYPSFPADKDFFFVQTGMVLHDRKMQSKPTTFFKDALKRFAMNKSSVIAAVILGVLMLMSVIVPVADRSDINTPYNELAFLSPKLWDGTTGFLDGTVMKNSVLINPATGLPSDTTLYKEKDIVGGKNAIKTTVGETSAASPYAFGGSLWLVNGSTNVDGGIYSSGRLMYASDTYSLSITFDKEKCNASSPKAVFALELAADFDSSSKYASVITLKNDISTFEDISINDVTTMVRNSDVYLNNGSPAIFAAQWRLRILAVDSAPFPNLYVTSLTIKNETDATHSEFDKYSFADGNAAAVRYDSENALYDYRWIVYGSGNHYVSGAHTLLGSFRYDQYDSVFGYLEGVTVGESKVQTYIDKGWMKYDFSVGAAEGPSTFVKLSDKCPIENVTKETKISFGVETAITLTCNVYNYKLLGYSKAPKFVFGTNANGNDYFKILFTGLRTSLALGLMTAVINIGFGLVWGAISGYFGGWTDLLMARFTEILGGVPWIVVMTLIILHLGSNFWSFLLALCLTGWMGISGETRSQFYRYKGREYVLASRTLGAKDFRLIFRHILPNGIGPVITGAVLMIPAVIFDEATISYLGLGFQGYGSFGVALSEAQAFISNYPYLIISGSCIVSLLMICFNLFGNGLRDAFNPSLKGVDNG